MERYAPAFYDPGRVGEIYIERAGIVADAAEAHRAHVGITPASTDAMRVAAFGIDCQIAFCTPGASLFVPGAVDDTRRTIAWLYANVGAISELVFSLDTHNLFQIFHPSWWRDAEGKPPPPMTPITHEDVVAARWRARAEAEALEYTKKLATSGKYVLTIWPYHALLGGISHALVPSLMEAAMFHSVARNQPIHFETKGTHAMTENYSVLSPEVTELGGSRVGAFNAALFEKLLMFDRIYVFGQAKSHCVLSTLFDLRDHIRARDPKAMQKIWILEDAMSPVPAPPITPLPPALDFPAVAERAMNELREAGMRIVKTTDAL